VSEARRIDKILRAATEKVIGKLQLRAWQSLTSATPVDTGFARSAWTPSTGSPADAALQPPSDDVVKREQAASQLASNEGRARNIANGYRFRQGNVFLSNGVPYIGFLNAGSSSQAPANFVELAIADAVRSLQI